MTYTERRPGDGHRDGGRDRGRSAAEASARLDDPELLAEVWRIVDAVAPCRRGSIPGVGTVAWWRAPDDVKVAALLVLSEAWVIHDPERMARERLKALAVDLSAGRDWAAESRHPSYLELQRRRAAGAA